MVSLSEVIKEIFTTESLALQGGDDRKAYKHREKGLLQDGGISDHPDCPADERCNPE